MQTSATLTVTGDATGINVRGLAAGTYTLTEKSTSDGYNIMTTPITVTIDANGNATIGTQENVAALDSIITVNNLSGTVLPSTGGMGTTIFYIIGANPPPHECSVISTEMRLNWGTH